MIIYTKLFLNNDGTGWYLVQKDQLYYYLMSVSFNRLKIADYLLKKIKI